MQLSIYFFNDHSKVGWVFFDVDIIHLEDQKLTKLVVANPGFVALIQFFQVIQADCFLIFP